MASKVSNESSSKTFQDAESDDLDLDDLSIEKSSATEVEDDSFHFPTGGKLDKNNKRVTKQRNKQAYREAQLLKIELLKKNLAIQHLRSEHAQHIDELEERLHDLTQHKQTLQTRLETELQSEQEEAVWRQQAITREMDMVKMKQEHLEAVNERLLEKAGRVQQSLRDLSLSPARYYQLKGLRDDELSLRDLIAVRVYDMMEPLHVEIEQLKATGQAQDEQIAASLDEVMQLKKRLEGEHATNAELRDKLHKASLDLVECETRLQSEDCAVVHRHDITFKEEKGRRRQPEVDRQLTILATIHDDVKKERDQLNKQLSMVLQSEVLLKQDKDYLSRQLSECSRRAQSAEDRLQHVSRQLDDARQTREELYEKYVTSRDQYKKEYEKKLQEELDEIRARTESELEQLRASTKDIFERENRNLRNARDMALSERDRYQTSARESNVKCEDLTDQLHQVQSKADSQLSEMENEVKMKALEAGRSQMVCEETLRSLSDKTLEVEFLQKKEETLRQEYYSLQTSTEKRAAGLESQLCEKSSQLDTYHRLEKDLDQIIVQAAEASDDSTAEKVLFASYGNMPSNAKRRMQHSVQLARRVLHLEKENTALQKAINEEKATINHVTDKLEKSTTILGLVQQPYSHLVTGVREREERIAQLQQHLDTMEQQLRRADEENQKLRHSTLQMSADLHRLLKEREDNALLTKAVRGLAARQRAQAGLRPSSSATGGMGGEGGDGPCHSSTLTTLSPTSSTPSFSRSDIVVGKATEPCSPDKQAAPSSLSRSVPPIQRSKKSKKMPHKSRLSGQLKR